LLSGVLGTLAFAPFGLWPLIFVAFVPMVVGQHRVAPRRWSGAVVGVGISTYLAGQLSVGLHQGDVVVFFELLPLFFGAIFMAVAWRSRAFHERTGYQWLTISTPLAWVAIDFGRNLGAFNALGGTWTNPVYALWRHPVLLQPISVVGMYGLELLLLVINFTIAKAIIRRLDGERIRVVEPAAVAAVALVWVVIGALLMDDTGRVVRVAAIQTGTAGNTSAERFRRDMVLSREAAKQGAKLAVWSEVGLDFDPRTAHTEELRALARDTGMALSIGFGFDDSKGRHHNQVTLLKPDGTFSEPYGKDHPGTFAGDYSDVQGTYPVTQTAVGAVGTVICYDMDFTDTARKMTRNGARLIAASSSDVPAITDTHFTHLVFRSIENRVATVKGDKGFDSAIIDPWGRIKSLTTNQSGHVQRVLVNDVPLGSGKSPFVSFGDWMGWLAMLLTGKFVIFSKITKRRAKRTAPATLA
jgi:apolipoprotein N-acyltransferase